MVQPRRKKRFERRKNIRLSITMNAKLTLDRVLVLPGKTKNISFGGVFVEFDSTPLVAVGKYGSLTLLSGVEFTCKIVHLNAKGIGFQFDFIRLKYYEHFKKFMLHNASDPERLIKELTRQADYILPHDDKKL